MRVAADDYRGAAEKRVVTARPLHEAGRYAAAHYVAGLAVECLFRAYRRRIDPEFDARHDLDQLFVVSGFTAQVATQSPRSGRAIKETLAEVVVRWRNSRRICEASEFIVKTGLRVW